MVASPLCGYSETEGARQWTIKVASPLWGLFYQRSVFVKSEYSCFPVMGVILATDSCVE